MFKRKMVERSGWSSPIESEKSIHMRETEKTVLATKQTEAEPPLTKTGCLISNKFLSATCPWIHIHNAVIAATGKIYVDF
jgi:hypothetical protein